MYNKLEAINIMNEWGTSNTPFLFVIDFELKAIQLFQINSIFPDNIFYSFPDYSNCNSQSVCRYPFTFDKNPIPINIYETAFTKVIDNIKAGNSFLLNLTFPTPIGTNLTLREIFNFSIAKYKLLLGDNFVVFSPETFVRIKGGYIFSNPMKGTISASEPEAEKKILTDKKEMAEHYTIVDLIRNDLSLVAKNVKVSRFRYTERLQTNFGEIIQVSSEISGKLPDNYPEKIGDIIFSILPAGSVSGAPKKKTLEIIRQVEIEERGYYTGIFGYFDGQSLDSAVMIRFIEKRNGRLLFRSGGGITSQSNMDDEYNELISKVYVPFS